MDANVFLRGLDSLGVDFYTGVPDSLLQPLNDALFARHGLTAPHVVAANEGGAVALAAGHTIATGKPAMVYLQNSGIGNAVNPVASLLHERVYGIPCVFVVGWRGEPGVKDEPQHAFQGAVTPQMLELLGLTVFVLDTQTGEEAFAEMLTTGSACIAQGQSIAFLVRKGGLKGERAAMPKPPYALAREEAIRALLDNAGAEDCFISTTGKASRELYELRQARGERHDRDFLTVGSMGHAGMIALGMALAKPARTFWCLDGDGAALMHLGSLGVETQQRATNLIHVVLNNGAHESVGGMPVAGGGMRFAPVAHSLGFDAAYTVAGAEELAALLPEMRAKQGKLRFLEILLRPGSRDDLGRPTQTPRENLQSLMQTLQK